MKVIKQQLRAYEYGQQQMVNSLVSLTMEQDMKNMIRHIHLLLSATLNKWANIMIGAAENHISPYALNQEEYMSWKVPEN